MSKARRQVQENTKLDFVTILVDARLPIFSQNPSYAKIVERNPSFILNKGGI